MRAIRFENAGDADVIKLMEEPFPQVRPHDLLVRVYAAGLNRADILQRQGFYGKQPDFGDSVIPGLEIAGEVVEVGTAATGFRNGDRVMDIGGAFGIHLVLLGYLVYRSSYVPRFVSLSVSAKIWRNHVVLVSGKPCNKTTGGPSPAVT